MKVVSIRHPLADRLMWHLENWAEWMGRDHSRLGYPSHSAVVATGGGGAFDAFEIMADESEVRCAEIMDSIIDSLGIAERAAVYNKMMASVFRMRDIESAWESAQIAMIIGIRRKGLQ